MNQDNGGVIGKINTPTTSVASGVWSIQDQFEAQSSSTWPLAFPQTTIANSCRFDSASNDYLNRALSSGTGTTFTVSAWVKRSDTSKAVVLLSSGANSSNDLDEIVIQTDGTFRAFSYTSSYTFHLTTDRVFRDPAAWYNFMFVYDSTNSTSGDRARMYVNGSEITSFSAEVQPSQNTVSNYFNKNREHYISGNLGSTDTGTHYIAEYCFIDGQALTPSSFGAFNPVTNIWEPIPYAGTYGTNGFRLDFGDSSALGADVSGNSNNFTVNNLTSADQSTDTCSNNFATMNPLAIPAANTPTFAEGNTKISTNSSNANPVISTIGVSQGKWYAEAKRISYDGGSGDDDGFRIGFGATYVENVNLVPPAIADSGHYFMIGTGTVYNGSTDLGDKAGDSNISDNGVVGIALDLDNNRISWAFNGAWMTGSNAWSGSSPSSYVTIESGKTYFFLQTDGSSGRAYTAGWNFGGASAFTIASGNSDANGHGNFEYPVPSGYYALNTKNLAEFG